MQYTFTGSPPDISMPSSRCDLWSKIVVGGILFALSGLGLKSGRCEMRFEPIGVSRAALMVENSAFLRLAFHAHVVNYDSQVLAAKEASSLKLERAQGDLSSLTLKRPASTVQVRLSHGSSVILWFGIYTLQEHLSLRLQLPQRIHLRGLASQDW